MSNPQQPELARSRKTPALDPDAVAGVAASGAPASTDPVAPVPADNQPAHHPEQEQDKPDLDAFAARLGVATDERPEAATDERPEAATEERPGESAPADERGPDPTAAH